MPTLAEQLRGPLHAARAIAGTLGLRPHTVAIRSASWDGPHTGDGEVTEAFVAITERGGLPPKVRWLRDDEVAVGALAPGTVEIGPVTPENAITAALLRGDALATGDTQQLRIVGPNHPNGALYVISHKEMDKALRWMVRASPLSDLAAAVAPEPEPEPEPIVTEFMDVGLGDFIETENDFIAYANE